MANNPSTLPGYNGQTAAPDANYTYGSARDDAAPGDLTGTPRIASEINDIMGFQQALLNEALIVPTGNPDTVLASQYLDAINKIVTRTYATVAALKLATLPSGLFVKTGGYFDGWAAVLEPRGAAFYSTATLAEVRAERSDGAWVPDELVNHTMANGNVVVITYDGYLDAEQAGAIRGGTIDATASFQAAIDWANNVMFKGLYLIDPATSVIVKDGTNIRGVGMWNSALLAKFNTAGSVIKRAFTPGVPNVRVDDVAYHNFAIFLNHVHQAAVPANIQVAFDMRNISRTKIDSCFAGNFRFGGAEVLFPNAASKVEAMRGYGYVYGNVPTGDIAYAGGEVHKNIDCKMWWGRKGITIDDADLSAGLSAAYKTVVMSADIQTVERAITQESTFNVGCTFLNNLIQDLKQASGGTDSVDAYRLTSKRHRIAGGYVETVLADLGHLIALDTTAGQNIIEPFYHDITAASGKILEDLSVDLKNRVTFYDENNKLNVIYNGAKEESFVKFHWDGGAIVIDGGDLSVNITRAGTPGDYTITYVDGYVDDLYDINVTLDTNASGHGGTYDVLSHSATNMRLITYAQDGGTSAQIDPRFVWVSISQRGA